MGLLSSGCCTGWHCPAEQAPTGQVTRLHGSSTQAPFSQSWPPPQLRPAQAVSQAPSTQCTPASQLTVAQRSASHTPSSLQTSPEGQRTYTQDWTQSPARQKVPAGQEALPQGSVTQTPPWQALPSGQPVT